MSRRWSSLKNMNNPPFPLDYARVLFHLALLGEETDDGWVSSYDFIEAMGRDHRNKCPDLHDLCERGYVEKKLVPYTGYPLPVRAYWRPLGFRKLW